MRIENWHDSRCACDRTLQLSANFAFYNAPTPADASMVATVMVQAYSARARVRAELGDAEGARDDMRLALARSVPSGDGPDGSDAVQDEADELESRLSELTSKAAAECMLTAESEE